MVALLNITLSLVTLHQCYRLPHQSRLHITDDLAASSTPVSGSEGQGRQSVQPLPIWPLSDDNVAMYLYFPSYTILRQSDVSFRAVT